MKDDLPQGLVGTLGVKVEDSAGNTIVALATTGIVEIEDGVYVATRTAPEPTTATTYAFIWVDPSIDSVVEPLYVGAQHPEATVDPIDVSWRPALAEVAALVPTRTVGDEDVVLGTFTSETEPTGDQVETLINLATANVASRVGSTDDLCTDALTSRSRGMAALYAAMLVELTYFPEQVNGNKSPYAQYKTLYDDGMDVLIESVSETCGGGGGEDPGGSIGGTGLQPSYDFGPYESVGRDTLW